jgi:hypothetical protein
LQEVIPNRNNTLATVKNIFDIFFIILIYIYV